MAKMSKAAIAKSLENLKADIALAVESATTMRERVQTALVGCVSHWKLTGSNVGLADIVNTFIAELGNGVNQKAVVAWCVKHLHMVPNADEDKLLFMPVKASDLDTKAAANQLWYTMKPQQPFAGFNLEAELVKLIKKAEKAGKITDEEKADKIKVDAKLLSALKAAAPVNAAAA